MPRLSVYFVRSSFLCMLLGFTIGGLMLAVKGGFVNGIVWLWFPAHMVILLNGWLIQLTIGVSYWIFPRILLADRGRPRWAWASFFLFEAGLLLVIATLLQIWWQPARSLLAPGVILQILGIAAYAVHALPRVRPAIIRS